MSAPSTSEVVVCRSDELVEDVPRHVDVDGEPVVLVRTCDDVFALRDVCSHQDVPLSEGDVEDCQVECWLHGSMFDLRTGEPTNLPATVPVPVYSVREEGGSVLVSLAPRLVAAPGTPAPAPNRKEQS